MRTKSFAAFPWLLPGNGEESQGLPALASRWRLDGTRHLELPDGAGERSGPFPLFTSAAVEASTFPLTAADPQRPAIVMVGKAGDGVVMFSLDEY